MKNEEENRELREVKPEVTPPPFRPSEEPQESEEQTASPTLADRIAELGLEEGVSQQLTQLTQGMDAASLSPELLSTLAHGITHDEDVKNADAAGFLRGRNEKIETVMHQRADNEDEADSTPVFPRYCRRSVWD